VSKDELITLQTANRTAHCISCLFVTKKTAAISTVVHALTEGAGASRRWYRGLGAGASSRWYRGLSTSA